MSRRAVLSVVGATAVLAASVAGASSASAGSTGAGAPSSVDFTNVAVYGSAQRDVTVTVSGSVTFPDLPTIVPVVGAEAQAVDFTDLTSTCTGTITDTTCTVSVTFSPSGAGVRVADLSIPMTAPDPTLVVHLTGIGVPDATGTFYGLATPTRFLDTRANNGAPIAAGSTRSVQITTKEGIPSAGVSAVVFNLTAVNTTANGFLTAYPSGTPRPTTSSINFPRGWTGANMVTLPVGADGKITLFNSAGSTHAIVDVLGWYAKDDTVRGAKGMGAEFQPTQTGDPVRVYDSRIDDSNGRLPFFSGDFLNTRDAWATPQDAATIKAYALTVTAVGGTGSGVFTAWAGGALPKPLASTVNYLKGVVAPNMVVVPAGHFDPSLPDGYLPNETGFKIQCTGSSAHMLVDVVGYYVADDTPGMRFKPLTSGPAPVRILDTRKGIGLSGPFGAGQRRTIDATSVSSQDSAYVVGNSTGVAPTSSTFLTVWSGENLLPGVSNLNVSPAQTRAVSTFAPLRVTSATLPALPQLLFDVYNRAGSMNVLFDAAGTLDIFPPTPSAPAGADAPATHDRTLVGRTLPGVSAFAATHERTSTRRG